MRIKIVLFLFFCMFLFSFVVAQQRDLAFYQAQAHANDPTLKEINNQQNINILQNDLIRTQYSKPQVNITADYLFAPYFHNQGKVISITTNPDKDAYGYDINLSNGGLYATQLNTSISLFSRGIINTYQTQTNIQNHVLQNANNRVLHELDKNISDQYIAVYQLIQQKKYQQKLIEMMLDRKKIVEAFVYKGLMQQSDYLLMEIEIKQRQYEIQQLNISSISAFNQLNKSCGISDTITYELLAPEIFQSPITNQFNYNLKYQLDSANIISQQNQFNIKYKPQLYAYGNTGMNATDPANIPHNIGLSAGLHLFIPLYDGGQRKTVEQQNKLLLDNLQVYQKQTKMLVENDLSSLQQQINLTKQSVELINSQISMQETLLITLKDKVVNGQISVTDYLISLQDYATSNQNRVLSQTNLWLLINQFNYIKW